MSTLKGMCLRRVRWVCRVVRFFTQSAFWLPADSGCWPNSTFWRYSLFFRIVAISKYEQLLWDTAVQIKAVKWRSMKVFYHFNLRIKLPRLGPSWRKYVAGLEVSAYLHFFHICVCFCHLLDGLGPLWNLVFCSHPLLFQMHILRFFHRYPHSPTHPLSITFFFRGLPL